MVLAQVGEAGTAEELRAELAGLDPELADASVRIVTDEVGAATRLVLSRPFPTREEAEALRRRLEQTHRTRLDVTEMPPVAGSSAADVVPGSRPLFLSLLPDPGGGLELEAVRWAAAESGPPAPGTPAVLDRFEARLQKISCRQQARAAWRAPDGGRLLSWVCEGAAEELLPAIHRALLTAPEVIRPPPARRAGKKKGKKAPPARLPAVADILEEAMPLPAASPVLLPWGEASAHAFSVKLPKERGAPAGEWSARLAPLPTGKGVFLALATSPELLERAMMRRWLGTPRGLLDARELRGLDALLPALLAQGEKLAGLGFERLADFARVQGGVVDGTQGRTPVLLASFCPEGDCWTLRAVELADPASAIQLYDRLLVGPRADFVRRVLSDKKFKVNYDVGLSMREVGRGSGWLLRGAGGGKWRELYFTRERRAFLLQAEEPAKGKPELDLVEKALRIPDQRPGAEVP